MNTRYNDVDEDIRLISLAKEGDDLSIKELIDKHSGICVDIYKKYINLPNVSGFISDDIISSKDYIIFNSAKTFDPSMGSKFSTWLANQTRFYCLNSINKYTKLIPVEDTLLTSLIETKNQLEDSNQSIEDTRLEIMDIVNDTLDSMSNKKIKKCIELKYYSDNDKCKSFTDIASEMGVTIQTVINWHNKFLKIIKQKCKNRKIIFDLH